MLGVVLLTAAAAAAGEHALLPIADDATVSLLGKHPLQTGTTGFGLIEERSARPAAVASAKAAALAKTAAKATKSQHAHKRKHGSAAAAAHKAHAQAHRHKDQASVKHGHHGNCTPVVTECCKDDGFGAHYNSMMRVYSYSKGSGVTYCATPWDQGGSKVGHAVGAVMAYSQKLWRFVGGSLFGPDCSTLSGAFCRPTRIVSDPPGDVPKAAVLAADRDARRNYLASPKPKLTLFSGAGPHLAVHVRRGKPKPSGATWHVVLPPWVLLLP